MIIHRYYLKDKNQYTSSKQYIITQKIYIINIYGFWQGKNTIIYVWEIDYKKGKLYKTRPY